MMAMKQLKNDFITFTCNEALTKEAIRQKVWRFLEDTNIAEFPRPVFHRIPNFKKAAQTCINLSKLECFQRANVVKVNPDKPQEHIRYLTLECNKILLVPTPRLKHGLFNQIIPPKGCNKAILKKCATRQGLTDFSKPIELTNKIHIDLIVLGSVAVSKQGNRIGKGEGFADLEYGIMSTVGNIDDGTVIVSLVHDCQIFDDISNDLFGPHDVTLDFIISPTQLIKCEPRLKKPSGIIWSILTDEKLNAMPILRQLAFEEQKHSKKSTELNKNK